MTDSGERDPATAWALGQRLKEARGSLSLDKVAETAGVTRETVRSYETGRRADNDKAVNPRPQTLRAIAEALGIPVREAFQEAGIDSRHLRPHERQEAKPSSALVAKMHRLDPEMLGALELIVDRILRAGGYIAADAPPPVYSHEGEHPPAEVETVGGDYAAGEDPVTEPADHPSR
jgi:transcriptional regulator with XRE-family HTH domain